MARKLNKRLLALGTAAVITVYGAGYARTQSAASALARSIAPPAAITASTPAANTPTTITPSLGGPTDGATNQTASGYRDGTYTGSGSNRFGQVDVAVTIQSGQIASVDITQSLTHYPSASIAQLPSEVVNRQSAQIDLVSGATYSSRAFRDAVTQALSQAQGAAASTAAAVSEKES